MPNTLQTGVANDKLVRCDKLRERILAEQDEHWNNLDYQLTSQSHELSSETCVQ